MAQKIKDQIDRMIGDKPVFTEKDRARIYNKIKSARNGRQTIHRQPKWGVIIAYTLAAALFLFLGWQNFLEKPHQPSAKPKSVKMYPHAYPYNEFEKEKKFVKKYPKKYEIVRRMYFSLSYIENAQGEFEWGYPLREEVKRTSFWVDYKKMMDHTITKEMRNGVAVPKDNRVQKDGEIFQLMRDGHGVIGRAVNDSNKFYEKMYMGERHSLITNSEWVSALASNYGNWTYQKGKKFGLTVYKIKGVDRADRRFTMTVAKDTGALLDLKIYNKNQLEYYITVLTIQINKGVSDSQFYVPEDLKK